MCGGWHRVFAKTSEASHRNPSQHLSRIRPRLLASTIRAEQMAKIRHIASVDAGVIRLMRVLHNVYIVTLDGRGCWSSQQSALDFGPRLSPLCLPPIFGETDQLASFLAKVCAMGWSIYCSSDIWAPLSLSAVPKTDQIHFPFLRTRIAQANGHFRHQFAARSANAHSNVVCESWK